MTTPEAALDAITGDTHPAVSPVRRVDRTRRWMRLGAAAVLLYAAATLVVAWSRPDLGFFAYQGSPIITVEAGSAAAQAGLAEGDVLVAVNGEAVDSRTARAAALRDIAPGSTVALTIERDGVTRELAFTVGRTLPMASAAGILLAALLLGIALLADRGGPRSLPRAFFRSTLIYMVFLAGAFSVESAMHYSALAVPWIFAMTLAAPTTCHFMLRFPAGRQHLTRRQWLAMYVPPVVLATLLSLNHGLFLVGSPLPGHLRVTLWGGIAAIAMAAAYLTVGAVARARRLRRKRNQVDPIAIRWLQIGGVVMAVPLLAGVAWATRDMAAFVAGGFRPFVAVTMVGGAACVVLAMTRTPFGELDRMWRRSSGYFLATSLAAGLYLGLIGLLGGTASVLSGGDFQAALGATFAAAIVFGPVRVRLQQTVDQRFARDRSRARKLLREAAEAAAATLDIDALQAGVVHRVRAALGADGAAIYVADDEAEGGWRRVAVAGSAPIGRRLASDAPIARRLDAALTARAPRVLCANIVAVPLALERAPAALVVAPRDGHTLDDEERELLMTAGAGLVVALGNARAHRALQELTGRLRDEVELAEMRRREIARLKDRVEEENRALIGQLASRQGRAPVIGKGLRRTFELVQKVGKSDASALVRGETGVGKELVARAIHAASSRRDGPFIVVDCGAIAAGVFESELFGHVKGAFTGAVRDAQGAFRAADGGTIFLDEVGELPRELQPKLLRVLQEREVTPVGAAHPIAVDVRVVAGTNRDLAAEVVAGAFREDLLYRLQVVEIEVPPLRQRASDIPALAEHFLARLGERTGRPPKSLAPDALQALLDHSWPGNVRELEHAIEAASVYAEGEEIRASDLPVFEKVFREKGRRAISESSTLRVTADGAPKTGLRETLEELESQRLAEALAENNGNKTRTAKALGMSRGALLRRLKRYGIG